MITCNPIPMLMIAACILVACDRANDEPSTAFAKVQLSPEQLVELKQKADTNEAVAIALCRYYQFTVTNAHEAATYMAKVASISRKPSDQYEAGILLLKTDAKTNLPGAKKWLETAAANGYKPAKTALETHKARFDAK